MQDVAPGMHGKLPCRSGMFWCVLASPGVYTEHETYVAGVGPQWWPH